MNARIYAGFTLIEFLVCVVVIGVLIAMALPQINRGPNTSPTIRTLGNMKQLHLATQQMVLDGVTTGDTNLGWPGDTGGTISTWANNLVTNGYLSTNDFCKLLSAPGKEVPLNRIPTAKDSAVLVYAVRNDSPPETVFLTSANFTNSAAGGIAPKRFAKPFGDKGIVLFRKGGEGASLMSTHAGMTNVIGPFVPLCK